MTVVEVDATSVDLARRNLIDLLAVLLVFLLTEFDAGNYGILRRIVTPRATIDNGHADLQNVAFVVFHKFFLLITVQR